MFLNIPYFKRKNENDHGTTSDSELVVDKFKGHLFEVTAGLSSEGRFESLHELRSLHRGMSCR